MILLLPQEFSQCARKYTWSKECTNIGPLKLRLFAEQNISMTAVLDLFASKTLAIKKHYVAKISHV